MEILLIWIILQSGFYFIAGTIKVIKEMKELNKKVK